MKFERKERSLPILSQDKVPWIMINDIKKTIISTTKSVINYDADGAVPPIIPGAALAQDRKSNKENTRPTKWERRTFVEA